MSELADLQEFRAGVRAPDAAELAVARARFLRELDGASRTRASRRRRVLIGVAIAALAIVGAGLAVAESGVLDGPPAPPVQDAALQRLFPPLQIGHAVTLASYDGRSFFGARTASGGYCFSATSPLDPDAEGGHCVSPATAAKLDAGEAASTLTSSWSVGGYAPGAASIHLEGPGIDESVPVASNGWWVGVADPHIAHGPDAKSGDVTATALAADGSTVETTTIYRIESMANGAGIGIVYDPPAGETPIDSGNGAARRTCRPDPGARTTTTPTGGFLVHRSLPC